MRLHLDRSVCSACDLCIGNCPKAPSSRELMRCRHCPPATAKCRRACPKGAIHEVAKGLLSINEKCDGCGACAKACPHGAILMEGKRAEKCDLCLGHPMCVSACPDGALHLSADRENMLGWRVLKCAKCVEDEYAVDRLPELSDEEEGLVVEVCEDYKEASKSEDVGEELEEAKAKIGELIAGKCARDGIRLDAEQARYLADAACMSIRGFGVLDLLIGEKEFEEIAVIGVGKPIYAYRRGKGWLRTNCLFTREETVIDVINKMARPLGRRVTLQQPRLNAVLPDGSRLHASIPPISGVEMTIRKFRESPIAVSDLVNNRTYSAESLAFLWLAVQCDVSVLVAGNTASGKTSTMNALFSFVPLGERVLVTEETPEINIPHEHVCKLLANQELGIRMSELVADSLRMRPDRVIVGEVRTQEEVHALFETILSGQARGSFATFHAQSAREALARLCSHGILPVDLQSLDLIIVQRRMARVHGGTGREVRRCMEICELEAVGGGVPMPVRSSQVLSERDGMPELVPIFSYDYGKDALVGKGTGKRLSEKIRRSFGFSQEELEKELAERSAFISKISERKTGFFESVNALSGYSGKRR